MTSRRFPHSWQPCTQASYANRSLRDDVHVQAANAQVRCAQLQYTHQPIYARRSGHKTPASTLIMGPGAYILGCLWRSARSHVARGSYLRRNSLGPWSCQALPCQQLVAARHSRPVGTLKALEGRPSLVDGSATHRIRRHKYSGAHALRLRRPALCHKCPTMREMRSSWVRRI